MSEKTINKQMQAKQDILKVFIKLEEYARKNDEECDYVLLNASQFYSGFNKQDVKNINIVFNENSEESINKFGEVVTLLSGQEKWRDDFFYIYHNRSKSNCVNKKVLFDSLITAFL